TKPPARYSEAALVKELEKRGIGRPSTYAAIISTIQERGYVRVENKRFYAEKIGDIVTDRLVENFADLMDYGFTATMEGYPGDIAEAELPWKQVLDNFYRYFSAKLAAGQADGKGMRPTSPTETNIPCDLCGRPMMIRTGTTGVFLGCSGYALPPAERCKGTRNLIPGDEAVNVEDDRSEEHTSELQSRENLVCGTAMDSYLLDDNRKLHICGNNPDCAGYEL